MDLFKQIKTTKVLCIGICVLSMCPFKSFTQTLYPRNNAIEINPDTHLQIKFDKKPTVGEKGKILIYDWETNKLIDSLDLSIPAGPTKPQRNPKATYSIVPYRYVSGNFTNANTRPGTPSGTAKADTGKYQLTIIGGFTDGFHFYPIIVHDSIATIYLHNNLLKYDKRYYVLIDKEVFSFANSSFKGIKNKKTWSFTTQKKKPAISKKYFLVDGNGKGDFSTLQGALDAIPDYSKDTITIFIKNGIYEELVYFRNKTNLIIEGESRDGVILQYANNEVFNPHPWEIKTNEWIGTFPSRRAPFAIDHCRNIQLRNLTTKTLLQGQAEGLLINGEQIFVKNVHVIGSGDALQSNGTVYYEDVLIHGGGDMILGRGAAFFKDCEFYSGGPFMWVRNTQSNHGNVFVNCIFHGTNPNGSDIARAPGNKGHGYPYCEAVLLNCKLDNISPRGWGNVGKTTKNIHYWEFNSTELTTGKSVDVSQRANYSRQLTLLKDKDLIERYCIPSFILAGWTPTLFETKIKK